MYGSALNDNVAGMHNDPFAIVKNAGNISAHDDAVVDGHRSVKRLLIYLFRPEIYSTR